MRDDRATLTCDAGRDGPHPAVGKDGKPTNDRLCDNHFDKLGKALISIEIEAASMAFDEHDPEAWAAVPSMALAWTSGRGAMLASQRTPARLDPIVLSDTRQGTGWAEDEVERHAAGRTVSALPVLCYWTDRVRAGRAAEGGELSLPTVQWVDRLPGVPPPCAGPCGHYTCLIQAWGVCPAPCRHASCQSVAWHRSAPAERTVKTERRLLTRQLRWIAGQEWTADFYKAMRTLLGQLQQANGTSTQRPIPGECPNLIDGKECGGPLWPTRPKETSQSVKWTGSAPSAIRCGSCTTRWEGPGPLALLAIILDKQKRAKATA